MKLKGDSFYNRDKTERHCRLATHRPCRLRRCTLRRDSVVGLAVGGRREALGRRLCHSRKWSRSGCLGKGGGAFLGRDVARVYHRVHHPRGVARVGWRRVDLAEGRGGRARGRGDLAWGRGDLAWWRGDLASGRGRLSGSSRCRHLST